MHCSPSNITFSFWGLKQLYTFQHEYKFYQSIMGSMNIYVGTFPRHSFAPLFVCIISKERSGHTYVGTCMLQNSIALDEALHLLSTLLINLKMNHTLGSSFLKKSWYTQSAETLSATSAVNRIPFTSSHICSTDSLNHAVLSMRFKISCIYAQAE